MMDGCRGGVEGWGVDEADRHRCFQCARKGEKLKAALQSAGGVCAPWATHCMIHLIIFH